jgi:uncharacterized protein
MAYKINKYIYTITKGDIIVIMNLLNQNIFALTKDKFSLLNSNLEIVEKIHKHLFSAMRKLDIVIPIDTNEIDQVKYINRSAVFADRSYRLTINPTLECNFSCWYCYEKHPHGKINSTILNAIYKLIKHKIEAEKIPHLILDWFGGEL